MLFKEQRDVSVPTSEQPRMLPPRHGRKAGPHPLQGDPLPSQQAPRIRASRDALRLTPKSLPHCRAEEKGQLCLPLDAEV